VTAAPAYRVGVADAVALGVVVAPVSGVEEVEESEPAQA
jgi:hypothetical protein